MSYPLLFDKAATDFTAQGKGALSQTISCEIPEELNGSYELSMVYPITGPHYDEIGVRDIVLAQVSDGSWQPFRIYAMSRPMGGRVTINARHISYDLNKVTVTAFSTSGSGSSVFSTLKTKAVPSAAVTNYTFWTDISGSGSISCDAPTTFRSMLGDDSKQSMVNGFLGEFEWDGFTVKLHEERGQDRGVSIRYAKNMTDITADIEGDIYNAVLPYAKGNDDQMVVGNLVVYNQAGLGIIGVQPLDLSSEFDDVPSTSQVEAAAQSWMTKNRPWTVIKEISVHPAPTNDNTSSLTKVLLGDTVLVEHADLGINEKLRVVKLVWNVLKERNEEVGLGDALRLLSARLATAQKNTAKKISKNTDMSRSIANGSYKGGSLVNERTVSNAAIVGGTLDVGPITGSSPQDYNFRVDSSGNVKMSGNIDLKGSVRAFGNFTVLKKADIAAADPQPVGHMGEAFGDDGSGSESKGVALAYSSDPNALDDSTDCFVICTPNGVRLQSKGNSVYVTAYEARMQVGGHYLSVSSSGAYYDGSKIATETAVQNAINAAQNNGGGNP